MTNIEAFWDALERLTFAETVEVAITLRDAHDAGDGFETHDVQAWAFLLNTAREIAQASEEVE